MQKSALDESCWGIDLTNSNYNPMKNRIVILISIGLYLQCCTIYNRLPTPIDQVVNQGKVKMVRKNVGVPTSPVTITTEYKNIFLLKDQKFGGLKKDNTIEPLLFDAESTSFYLKNRKKSITGTVVASTLGGAAILALAYGLLYLMVHAMYY